MDFCCSCCSSFSPLALAGTTLFSLVLAVVVGAAVAAGAPVDELEDIALSLRLITTFFTEPSLTTSFFTTVFFFFVLSTDNALQLSLDTTLTAEAAGTGVGVRSRVGDELGVPSLAFIASTSVFFLVAVVLVRFFWSTFFALTTTLALGLAPTPPPALPTFAGARLAAVVADVVDCDGPAPPADLPVVVVDNELLPTTLSMAAEDDCPFLVVRISGDYLRWLG